MSQRQPIGAAGRSDAGALRPPPIARREPRLAYPALELRAVATPTAAHTAARPSPEVDLVWRRPSPAASKPSDGPQVLQHSAASAAKPSPRTAAAKHPAATLDDTGPVRLDASTADRLADEVIKRVERQLRIERERRGL